MQSEASLKAGPTPYRATTDS